MLGIFMLGIFMAAFLELGNNPSMIFLQSSTKHAPMTQLCLDKRCRMDNTCNHEGHEHAADLCHSSALV